MEENKSNNGGTRQPSNIWIGLVFIFGGAVVLLNQMNILSFELNWWALFILLPAFGILNSAYNRFRAIGSLFSMDVTVPALIGLFMVGLSFSLLVGIKWNINWSLYWPIILILIGLGMIFGRSRKS